MKTATPSLPLSAIVLAHQDTEVLADCLSSLAFTAETVVIDTSPDGSLRHLSTTFPQITYHSWPQPTLLDWSALRNKALTTTHYDWTLMLDSDEVLTPESQREIAKVVGSSADGCWVTRQDIFYGQVLNWGEAGSTQLIRLFRKSRTEFIRPVHEVAQVNGSIMNSSITIHHFAHSSISAFIKKLSKYSQLEAQFRADNTQETTLIEMVTFPIAKFLVNFFLKLGFLDGWRGFVYAVLMSCHSFWVRVYLYEQTFTKTNT